MLEAFKKLQEKVNGLSGDAEKAQAGNKSAGVRLRKGMQDIKAMAQEVRQSVLTLGEVE